MSKTVFAFFVAALCAHSSSAQSTWYVDANAMAPGAGTLASPYNSIQYAIDQPSTLAGDTIEIGPGVYAENVSFDGKDLHLYGAAGSTATVIDANDSGSALTIASGETNAIVEGLSMQGGSGTSSGLLRGGGVFALGTTFSLIGCRVEDNQAESGAGLYAASCVVTLTETTIRANTIPSGPSHIDRFGAGLYLNGSSLDATNLYVEGNLANNASGGGAAFIQSNLVSWTGGSVEDNTVRPESQAVTGGGVFAYDSPLDFQGILVRHNSAISGASGGGMSLNNATGSIDSCLFEQNGGGTDVLNPKDMGGDAGALLGHSAGLSVSNCDFSQNLAGWHGGAASVTGVNFTDCTFTQCQAQWGGAVSGGSYANCTFENNQATTISGSGHFGGAARSASLENCTIANNYAAGAGGGIDICTAVDCEIFGNTVGADGGFAQGGGANNSTLVRCNIYNNQVGPGGAFGSSEGGGCFGGSLSLCDVYNNSAQFGGGVAAADVDRSVIYANTAAFSGGGYESNFANMLTNSILWDNAPDQIEDAPFGSPGGLVAEYCDVQSGYAGVGNINADPMFWLPDTGDFYLMPNSPCIDAGDPAILDQDQTAIEIGSKVFDPGHCPSPTPYCVSTMTSDGCLAAVTSTGSPSGGAPFTILASSVPSAKAGLMFYGTLGSTQLPFQGGTLCVQPPLKRTDLQFSGGRGPCGGTYSFDFAAQQQADPLLTFGTQVNAQFWFRDTGAPSGVGLSNAIAFAVCQ